MLLMIDLPINIFLPWGGEGGGVIMLLVIDIPINIFLPWGVGGGGRRGRDCQNSHCHPEFEIRLWHRNLPALAQGQDLKCFSRNILKELCLNL